MKILLLALSLTFGAHSLYSQSLHKDSLYIGLKDGTIIRANKLVYKTPAFAADYLLLNDITKIKPSTVQFYQNQSGYYLNAVTNKYKYEQFYKRTLIGKISMYSKTVVSNSYNPTFGAPGSYGTGWTHSRRVIELMQKNGSAELLTLNYKNLYKLTSDNEECLPLLKKVRNLGRTSTYCYAGGLALFISGGVQMLNSVGNSSNQGTDRAVSYNPLLLVGGGISLIPLVLNLSKRDKIQKTLDVYNSY
jgi:hypothetical protein